MCDHGKTSPPPPKPKRQRAHTKPQKQTNQNAERTANNLVKADRVQFDDANVGGAQRDGEK